MRPCPIPAHTVIFTDQGSAWHLAMGAIAGVVPPPWNLAAVAMFTGYEVSKLKNGESAARTGGKFLEFGLGLVAAGLLVALGVKL
jgi:hypothetical protein